VPGSCVEDTYKDMSVQPGRKNGKYVLGVHPNWKSVKAKESWINIFAKD